VMPSAIFSESLDLISILIIFLCRSSSELTPAIRRAKVLPKEVGLKIFGGSLGPMSEIC